MALRAVGKRRPTLHAAAVKVATRLAASPQGSARWIGKDALRELGSSSVTRRIAAAFVTSRTPPIRYRQGSRPADRSHNGASAPRGFRRHRPSTIDTEAVAKPLHCDIHRQGFGLLQLPVQHRFYRNVLRAA